MRPDRIEARFGSTRYWFGWGTAQKIVPVAREFGSHVLLTSSPGGAGQPEFLDQLRADLEGLGGSCSVFRDFGPNPDVSQVDEAAKEARSADVIVAVGGGSVLDASKALAVVAGSSRPCADWLAAGRVEDDTPRRALVLVPTTAGTGSELSHGAILSDRTRDYKGGLRGARLAPDAAIVDPQLTVSAPAALTARTAFDVTCHAVESYLSGRSNPTARMLSAQALGLVARGAPAALADPGAREARADLAYASSLMGLNLATVGTCLPHRLQYAMGGVDPTLTHGEGLAWIYPVWLRHAFDHARAEIRDLFALLELQRPENGGQAAAGIARWLGGLGVDTRARRDARFTPHVLAEKTVGPFDVDPIPEAHTVVAEMFREIFA